MKVETVNPATEEVLATYSAHAEGELERLVEASGEAYRHWREVSLATRVECVKVLAQGLRGARVALAERMTQEMGKPVRDSLAEVDKCVKSIETLAELYPRWREALEYRTAEGFAVTREPLGPVFGIMPWNFPLWQVVRFAVPTLLSGNTILLKHAPNTWGSAEMMFEVFRQALPDAVYQNLRLDNDGASRVIADPRVRGVSLTGSVRAGRSVGEQAGRALKKCVLELGGSDAYVVLDDADVADAAKICAEGRLVNTGQSCVAAKRFLVTKKNAATFTDAMVEAMRGFPQGDPMSPDTRLGPLARRDLRDALHEQVQKSLKAGARTALGAQLPATRGYFYPPSVLVDVRPGQPAFDEELFGPVAAIVTVENEDEAFRLANQSQYGLGGAIFSRDPERAQRLARERMECGMVVINDFVKSDAHAPFGGLKSSGLGRELGREGCFEFTNVKSVFVKA